MTLNMSSFQHTNLKGGIWYIVLQLSLLYGVLLTGFGTGPLRWSTMADQKEHCCIKKEWMPNVVLLLNIWTSAMCTTILVVSLLWGNTACLVIEFMFESLNVSLILFISYALTLMVYILDTRMSKWLWSHQYETFTKRDVDKASDGALFWCSFCRIGEQ